ncbi:MAG: glutamate-cysteine ligase family protein, partial [Rhizobiaceae bacterium]
TKVLSDPTKIWWDIRPHPNFPTVEIRICDICTRLEDAVAIAALCACITRMLYRLHRRNICWRSYSAFLLSENRWRAQRYGATGTLIDFGKGELVPFAALLDEIIDLTEKDADALGCMTEINHLRTILKRGTSADRQVARYKKSIDDGREESDAMRDVVDSLLEDTMAFATAPEPA